MIGIKMKRPSHLSDGDLARYHDTEFTEVARVSWERHVDECDDCRKRLAAVEQQSADLSRLLVVTDLPVPDMVRPRLTRSIGGNARVLRTRVRAATVAFVVMGAALSVRPIRAWVVDRLRDLRLAPAENAAEEVSIVAPGEEGQAVITFSPTSPVLVVRISGRQAEGNLAVVITDMPTVSVTVWGGEDEEFILLPDGLRILNTPQSFARYRLSLPSSVTSILVEIGNEPRVRRELAGEQESGWFLDLAEPNL